MSQIKVIITQLPIESFSYFQWFLLGLYQLRDDGKIHLKFKISLIDRIVLLWFNNKYLAGGARRILNRIKKKPRYNLKGFIISENLKKTFAIDSKDSPFIFTIRDLINCDCYFKNQCPKSIEIDGFNITPSIKIPYFDVSYCNTNGNENQYSRKTTDIVYSLKEKIYPGMVGPRRLAWSCKYSNMKKQYNTYLNSQHVKPTKKLIAYFGNAKGPMPTTKKSNYDLDWESDLMSFLNDRGNHPNEKRANAVRIINNLLNKDYDGRIIIDNQNIYHKDLVVPLYEFCNFIAQYNYNLNISGYRLSIPNRFIESFIGGTAIVTDKLYVKWFHPFDKEVYESIDMGYLLNTDVNWTQFSRDIENLPTVTKEEIIDIFNKKWAPKKFANYIITTTINSVK